MTIRSACRPALRSALVTALRPVPRSALVTALRPALRPALVTALLGIWVAAAPAASAHEFWLEPTAFNAPAGGPIGIYVCNGSGFEGWSLPRDPRRIEEFVAVGPDGSHPVVGLDGSEPAGIVRLTGAGSYVLAYRSNRAMTVQPDEKFDAYLREKGLDAALATRNKERHGGGRVRESYSRYAKSLVRVSNRTDSASRVTGSPPDRVIGLPLEIVAENDLFATNQDTKTFRVLYRGKPLAGVLVSAMRPGTTDTDVTARTDSSGRVQFSLRKGGAWRIAAVHMVAPPSDVDADWDSLWASLTFELPGTADARPAVGNGAIGAGADSSGPPRRDGRCQNQVAATALQAQR